MSSFKRYCSSCTCFFSYGTCLGRKFGESLLMSNNRNPQHPVYHQQSDSLPPILFKMFRTQLKLSPKAIEELYDIFLLIDCDGSGEIDIDEFLRYFRLQKSRFAKRAFDVLDADGSGEIDFNEFVIGLFHFLTLDNVSLCRFAFTIYDTDASGFLDHDEIEKIVKDLYGRRGFASNITAQKCIAQLKSNEWIIGNGGQEMGGGKISTRRSETSTEIDFQMFESFCRNHAIMLLPAFVMQYDLQKRVLGAGFWDALALQRKQLEHTCKDDDLLKQLKNIVADEMKHIEVMHQEQVDVPSSSDRTVAQHFTFDACDTNGNRTSSPNRTSPRKASPLRSPSARSPSARNLKSKIKKNKYVFAGSPSNRRTCRSPTSPSSSSPASPSTSTKLEKKQMLKEKIKKELRDARRKKGQNTS